MNGNSFLNYRLFHLNLAWCNATIYHKLWEIVWFDVKTIEFVMVFLHNIDQFSKASYHHTFFQPTDRPTQPSKHHFFGSSGEKQMVLWVSFGEGQPSSACSGNPWRLLVPDSLHSYIEPSGLVSRNDHTNRELFYIWKGARVNVRFCFKADLSRFEKGMLQAKKEFSRIFFQSYLRGH